MLMKTYRLIFIFLIVEYCFTTAFSPLSNTAGQEINFSDFTFLLRPVRLRKILSHKCTSPSKLQLCQRYESFAIRYQQVHIQVVEWEVGKHLQKHFLRQYVYRQRWTLIVRRGYRLIILNGEILDTSSLSLAIFSFWIPNCKTS